MSGIGIDIGSTYTKYCILDEDSRIQALFSEQTPVRQKEYFAEKLPALRERYGDLPMVSCGYGRKNIGGSRTVTELSALARGVWQVSPGTETVLDIGGQDTKLIRQKGGKVTAFFVNDKCAAGCGMFLENVLKRLGISFETVDLTDGRLPGLRLSAACAVFAQSEIVGLIAEGVLEEEILRAVIVQILTQAKSLLSKVACDTVALSGGLAQIPGIEKAAREIWERPVSVLENAAYLSALGCAQLAEKER